MSITVEIYLGTLDPFEAKQKLHAINRITAERGKGLVDGTPGSQTATGGVGVLKIAGVTEWINPFPRFMQRWFEGRRWWQIWPLGRYAAPAPLIWSDMNLYYRAQIELAQVEAWRAWFLRVTAKLKRMGKADLAARIGFQMIDGFVEEPDAEDLLFDGRS